MSHRECGGLPAHTPRCALCAVLYRLGGLGHRGVLTPTNLDALVNRLRLLHSEALDVLDSGSQAVAAAKGPPAKPPDTWEGASPGSRPKVEGQPGEDKEFTKGKDTTSRTPSTTRSKRGEKERESAEAPVTDKKGLGGVKSPFIEVAVEEGSESAEEERPEEDVEVSPEVDSDKVAAKDHQAKKEEERSEEKRKLRREKGSRDGKRKRRSKSSQSRRASRRSRSGRRVSRESHRKPKLRPKSPSYPPPTSKRKREASDRSDWKERSQPTRRSRSRPAWSEQHWEDWNRQRTPWKRSKGVVRAQRWQDIQEYGPDSSRKAIREEYYKRW